MLGARRATLQRSLQAANRLIPSLAVRQQAVTMTSTDPIEEETLPKYRPENYYPVSIGQVFSERYKVLAKLGFGGGSTTWLAQDITKYFNQNYPRAFLTTS